MAELGGLGLKISLIFVLSFKENECFHQYKYRVYLQVTMNQSIKTKNIVKNPTITSIQLKATSTAVGFDTIMTLHHPPRQELYSTLGEEKRQCKLTYSSKTILDHLRQLP